MSKNRNRAKLNKAKTNKEYKFILNYFYIVDCTICAKRAGNYTATCYPIRWTHKWKRGFKNPHKSITTFEARAFRSWKHNRKTQWK
jgi:hypothetical protein